MKDNSAPTHMGYVLTKETAIRVVTELRKKGEIVVLTHGAYDLFHIGHYEFLRRSKQKGYILAVGVDGDERISHYKNIARPIIPLEERMKILSGLQCVDFVFPLFGKDTSDEYYFKLYDRFQPFLITYGKNYAGTRTISNGISYFEHIRFKKILTKYSNVQTTTKVINKIIKAQS